MAAIIGDPTENNGAALVGTAVAFLILTYISVALRTYVRAILTKSFQADDWLMLIAQLVFTLSCSFILAGVWEGIGRHNKSLPQRQEIEALKWQALATATYVVNMMFIKLSIAVFLLRLAVQKPYKYTLWISMAIVAIWSSVIFVWDIFQCSPVQAQWDYTIPNLQCVTSDQIVSAAYSISVMTILTDWLYALLPIPMVWKVKMTKQAKATVVVILGLGIFASVATLIRLKFLADLNDTADILFAGTDAMTWTLVEPGVAIIASSLVTIKPLLRQMRIPGFSSAESSKYGPNGEPLPRSGTNRSRGMPGFGPGDLTLIDMETGDFDDGAGPRKPLPFPSAATTLAAPTPTSRLSRVTEADDTGLVYQGTEAPAAAVAVAVAAREGGGGRGGRQRERAATSPASSKSESIFVIEGPRQPSPAAWREDESSFHSDDHEAVEVHSQHDGKVGLGSDSWGR